MVEAAAACEGISSIDQLVNECMVYSNGHLKTLHQDKLCPRYQREEKMLFKYRSADAAEIQWLTRDQVQDLMKCIYTSTLLFQFKRMVRNYPFWGYTEATCDTSQSLAIDTLLDQAYLHPALEIRQVPSIQGLGLFTSSAIDQIGTFIGEYTGIVMENLTPDNPDPYGMFYPCVHEQSCISLSASEYGNIIRCINHTEQQPNVAFRHVIHHGILHVVCVTVRPLEGGDQLMVNYGPSYWNRLGIKPNKSL